MGKVTDPNESEVIELVNNFITSIDTSDYELFKDSFHPEIKRKINEKAFKNIINHDSDKYETIQENYQIGIVKLTEDETEQLGDTFSSINPNHVRKIQVLDEEMTTIILNTYLVKEKSGWKILII